MLGLGFCKLSPSLANWVPFRLRPVVMPEGGWRTGKGPAFSCFASCPDTVTRATALHLGSSSESQAPAFSPLFQNQLTDVPVPGAAVPARELPHFPTSQLQVLITPSSSLCFHRSQGGSCLLRLLSLNSVPFCPVVLQQLFNQLYIKFSHCVG